MGIDERFALVFNLIHELTYHKDSPHDAQEVIDVIVRDKDASHIHPVVTCVFYLRQYGFSAAVNHDLLSVIVQNETGVVALRYKCIACSEHCKFHTVFSFVPREVLWVRCFISS